MEEERLGFEEGDLVCFSEVKGMPGLNTAPPAKVKSKSTYAIEVELDSSMFGAYVTGGFWFFFLFCCKEREHCVELFVVWRDSL